MSEGPKLEPPIIMCACEERAPGLTMGSRRVRAIEEPWIWKEWVRCGVRRRQRERERGREMERVLSGLNILILRRGIRR